jgi:hypothetical protein
MELTNTLQLASTADLTQQITELCRTTHLPGPYDPKHLPKDLRDEQDSYERQMQYHLGAALSLYQKKSAELQIKMDEWWETAYYYEPSELLLDNKWENFFPGVVISGKPYRDFADAEENTEEEQRFLTTQLLTGAITKKGLASILTTAQGLVCALDPREETFFSEETLTECLEKENLTTPKAVNAVLNRKPYTPVRKDDRRIALAKVWTERRVEKARRNQYLYCDWEQEHIVFSVLDAVRAFTQLVFNEIADSANGYGKVEFETALWEVLRVASESGQEEEYFLDPRDEDTWTGLQEVAEAIRSTDLGEFHLLHQDGVHAGQEWIRTTALPALYGACADWWAEHPALEIDANCDQNEILLVSKSSRTPYEDMVLFKLQFGNRVVDSELRHLTREKYGQKVREVFGHA